MFNIISPLKTYLHHPHNPIKSRPEPCFSGGVPRYEPDVFFGRKHGIHRDVTVTAPDGDRYPQFNAWMPEFPFPVDMTDAEMEQYLFDYWV